MNGNDAQKAQAVKEFLGWLSGYSPEVYAAVMDEVPEAAQALETPPHMEGIAGYGFGQVPQQTTQQPAAAPQPAWWEKALGAAAGVAESFFQYKAQKDVLKVQQKRAEQGLPPISTDAYAPTIRHSVDIPPEIRQAAMGTGTIVALAAGAGLLLWMATR